MHYAIKAMKSQGKPLKILFVITQGAWGGAQRSVFDCATSLSQTHDITVAVGAKNTSSDLQDQLRTKAPGIRLVQLKHLVRPFSLIQDFLAIFELKKLYQTLQPDIVHLNSSKAGIVGSLSNLFSFPSWKTVYTVHGWVFLEPLNHFTKWLYKTLEKMTARFKNAFIILSPEEKEVGLLLGIPSSKISVIPLGIDPPKNSFTQTQAQNQLFSAEKMPRASEWIGTIAGLYPAKGIDLLIEAISKIKNHIDDTAFVIIGDGPERKNLEKKIQELQVSDIVFLVGKKENASELLSAFDKFVLPSKKEGQPYALLEAMSFHLPILATKVGGIPSLLEHYPNATICEPTSEALSEALLPFLKTTQNNHLPFPILPSRTSLVNTTEKLYYSLTDSTHQE